MQRALLRYVVADVSGIIRYNDRWESSSPSIDYDRRSSGTKSYYWTSKHIRHDFFIFFIPFIIITILIIIFIEMENLYIYIL